MLVMSFLFVHAFPVVILLHDSIKVDCDVPFAD